MRIVDRKTFLAMPPGTVFSKYAPCWFDQLSIKGDSWMESGDFLYQQIADSIDCNGSDDFADKLDDAVQLGSEVRFDFDSQGRDGLFDQDQLFAVWDRRDVEALIARLYLALATAAQPEQGE